MRARDLVRDRAAWILTGLTLFLFRRPLTTETFFFRDLYQLFIPKRFYFMDRISAGELPLWEPLTNGGQPFLASPQNMLFHPTGLLYLAMPTLAALNVAIVLHVIAAAVGAYWLARVLGLSATPAFIAGAAFAFCGYSLSAINLLPMLFGLPWIPITIALTHRAIRDRRSLVPPAIAAAMPLFSAAAELTAILFATLLIWLCVTRIESASRTTRLSVGAVIVTIAVGLSLVQTLPATSVIAQSARSRRHRWQEFTAWSVRPERLPELFVPRFLGDHSTMDEKRYWGRTLETSGYPYVISLYFGVTVLLLAVIGIASGDRRLPVRSLAVIAVAAILLSLGRNLPGFRLLYEVPGVATFRYPVKAMLGALLPMALLAAAGAEHLSVSPGARRRMIWAASILALGIAAGAGLLFRSDSIGRSISALFGFAPLADIDRALLSRSLLHAAIACGIGALAIAAMGQRPKLGAAMLAAVVVCDLLASGAHVNLYAPRSMFDVPPLAREVAGVIGNGRFHAAPRKTTVRAPDSRLMWLAQWQMATLDDYTATLYSLPVVYHSDYDGLAPKRISDLSRVIGRLPWPSRIGLLSRANVRVFISEDAIADGRVQQLGIVGGINPPLRLYLNRQAAAARFVSRGIALDSQRATLRRVALSNDLSEVVLEGSARSGGNCGNAAVQVLASAAERSSFQVDAPCDGFVVFAENHYDGWCVSVDGSEATPLRADYAFTAVAVKQGRHRIDRAFTQPRLAAGAAGSAIALLALLGASAWWTRRGASPLAQRLP